MTAHLSDEDLFALAIPAAGIPEALPSHLSDCLACTRALSAWKSAVRELADDAGSLDQRTAEEWTAGEDRTLEALRRTHPGRRSRPLGWAVGIAASLLIAVLAIPLRHVVGFARTLPVDSTALSAQDQADDALLRDVARMSRADEGDGSWSSLAPEPGSGAREHEEDHL